ncbi:MAG: carboxypeptidase-like regulatory domain-containing protein [Bacteroidales bacterium]|jgi:hypothetical protein|nr:carboxypeptidase-like regulatory domain-containing protein [Bacteroidales bacterium]
MKKSLLIIFLLFSISKYAIFAQNNEIYGRVTGLGGIPISDAHVGIVGMPTGTSTNEKGDYILITKMSDSATLFVTCIGYENYKASIFIRKGRGMEHNVKLKVDAKVLEAIVIEDKTLRNTTMTNISVREAEKIPSLMGDGITALVKAQPGVSSNNELSSQYNVRGGNYDENLVYVNNIEIYRPSLIRSGQQEGLPFINSDLTQNITFSSGGFSAKYGDKMSSVLDIKYKQPTKFAGSAEINLLGAKLHVEGATKNQKFNYLMGVRHKSNQYVLRQLQVKGDYKPSFTDVQLLLNWRPNNTWKFSGFGYYSRNVYKFVPTIGEVRYGSISDAYQLTIYYDGQEVTRYDNFLGSFSADYSPHANLDLRFITMAYRSIEKETFDILGEYWLGKIDSDMGSKRYGEVLAAEGVGTYLEHARNKMDAIVLNVEHIGNYKVGNSFMQWGVKYQYEDLVDYMNEWEMVDSAGFTIPHLPDRPGDVISDSLLMQHLVKVDNSLQSNRLSGFFQNTWEWEDIGIEFTLGARAQYWNVNNQFTVSPRANISYRPVNWKEDILFRFSTGLYHQPPFFKELKDLQGNVNNNVKAQEAIHFVLGTDWNFDMWQRPFKAVTEIYYKYLNNLIPYVIDNLNIRYLGNNMAQGYTTGIDFKLHGAFVPGTESWLSLSLMSTEQRIVKNYFVDGEEVLTGYMPRPTDQRFNVNIYFQDYIPGLPSWQIYLNFVFGTGLPVAAPMTRLDEGYPFRMPGYKRVDIGLSKQLIGEKTQFKEKNPLRFFKSMWISLEVFNLLNFSNVISYTWVQDVNGRIHGVPNKLTPRQINLKLAVSF